MKLVVTSVEEALRYIDLVPVLSRVTLFAGDRWSVVEIAVVATEDDEFAGLATLAPTDEAGQNGPHIIGLWVAPLARGKGIGTALLKALAKESFRRYGVRATVVAVTSGGFRAAEAARRDSAEIEIINLGMGFELP